MQRVKLVEKKERDYHFKKGRAKTGGRKPGTPNKVTADLKNAIMEAAAMVGCDGEGTLGIHGYLYRIALTHPKAYTKLFEKLLPMVVNGKMDHTVGPGQYETLDQLAEALKARGLPPPSRLIEINPRPPREESRHGVQRGNGHDPD